MSAYSHLKKFIDFMGLNLKADDLTRDRNFATESENVVLGDQGQLSKRPGYHTKEDTDDGGIFTHTKVIESSGDSYEQLVGFVGNGDNTVPYVCDDVNTENNTGISVYYSGGGIGELQIEPVNSTTTTLTLWENGSVVLSHNIFFETFAGTLPFINGTANFVASAISFAGNSSRLDYVPRQRIAGSSDPLIIKSWEFGNQTAAINIPDTSSIRLHLDAGIQIKPVNIKGVSYFQSNENEIWKYDGEYFSRAGLPNTLFTITPAIVGTNDKRYFAFQTRQIDYVGNEIFGPIVYSNQFTGANDAYDIKISVQEIAGNVKHLKANSATVLIGTANGIDTKTVDYIGGLYGTANQFKVGDKISSVAVGVIGKPSIYGTITVITGTTITYESATPNSLSISNGDYITHRLWVDIYGTINNGSKGGPYYLLSNQAPAIDVYDPSSISPVNFANAGVVLGSTLQNDPQLDQRFNWSAGLPKGNVLAKFQNSLIITGAQEIPGTVNFSDQQGPEQFDLGVNSFLVDGDVTGAGSTKEHLAIFTKKTIDVVTGDLPTNQFRVDRVSSDFGCLSHFTIVALDEDRLIYMTKRGPYQLINGLPFPLGKHTSPSGEVSSPLEPYFSGKRQQDLHGYDGTYRPQFDTAVGVLWPKQQLYLLYIKETQNFASNVDTLFVYDYDRNIWVSKWTGINFERGATIFLDDLWFESGGGAIRRFNKTNTSFDYNDSGNAIDFTYSFAWEHLNEPSIFKKFIRTRIYSLHATEPDMTSFNLTLTTQKDFNTSNTYTSIVNDTMTVGTPKTYKFKGMKSLAQRIKITNGTMNENISISAIDIEMTAPFKDIKE